MIPNNKPKNEADQFDSNQNLNDIEAQRKLQIDYELLQKKSEERKKQFLAFHGQALKQNLQESSASLYRLYKEGNRSKEEQYIQGKEDAYGEILKLLQSFRSARDLRHVPITQFMQELQKKLTELRSTKSNNQINELIAAQSSISKQKVQTNIASNNNNSQLITNNLLTQKSKNVAKPIENRIYEQASRESLAAASSIQTSHLTQMSSNSAINFQPNFSGSGTVSMNGNPSQYLMSNHNTNQPIPPQKSSHVNNLQHDFKQIAINSLVNQCYRETQQDINKMLTTQASSNNGSSLQPSTGIQRRIIGDISQIKIKESKKRLRPRDFDNMSDTCEFMSNIYQEPKEKLSREQEKSVFDNQTIKLTNNENQKQFNFTFQWPPNGQNVDNQQQSENQR